MRYRKHLALVLGLFLLTIGPIAQRPYLTAPEQIHLILQEEALKLDQLTKRELTATVLTLSHEYSIDPILILAVIKVESHFDPKALSAKGARGFMQLMPVAARESAKELDIKDHHRRLHEPMLNVRVGVHYLAQLIKRFKGDLVKALLAYNRGPTAVSRDYKNRSVPLNGYQLRVLNTYREFLKG